ncbi:hypothetical protein H2201_008216 [Coniosporium apollinis]|uniref:TAFII28-like protein domain-containing protein n=1 Tax=Coniosporium apollinis TaxID=61459 RepID=A0ABQ9NJ89_9PEZI|nr:hypothetical protein H2201_008216 [Coniosporium apollinis]
MASSPPYLANSPTLPTLSLPKKRPSFSGPGPGAPPPHAKRRKPSTGPSHLRQTSFPPETTASDSGERSPSVDSSIIAPSISLPGGAGAAGLSLPGQGRKRKARARDGESVVGGRMGDERSTTGTVVSRGKGGRAVVEEEEEEEETEEVGAVMEGGRVDEASVKQEREHLSMLVEALTPDQATRYDIWRRVKLKKETVRKITNQTLSQSVPPSVITTINGYTKLFIGELIDRARRVQEEWTVAAALGAAAEKERQKNASANGTQPTAFGSGASDAGSSQYSPRTLPRSFEPPVQEDTSPPTQSGRPLAEMIHERDKGPLTPDMLREALRRYKKDQEGGGTGFVGLSLEGRERAAVRTGGKRIFR